MSEPTGIEQSVAISLLAAAAGAAGPRPPEPQAQQEWERTVQETAFGLLRLVPSVVERSMVLAACTPITGVITAVDEVSGRGKITIRPTMGTGDGKAEDFRTAWLSEREGRAITTLARSLVGRHCRFGKRLESTKSGQQKVRMCEWIEELGPDPEASASSGRNPSAAAPAAAGVAAGAPGPAPLDVAELRRLRPGAMKELLRLANQHLGLDVDKIEHEGLVLLGRPSAGGRTKTQVLRLWNQLVTTYAVPDEPASAV